MNRRDFLRSTGIMTATMAVSRTGWSAEPPDGWRTFELTTRVEVLESVGPTRVWVPATLTTQTPYQRTAATTFSADGAFWKRNVPRCQVKRSQISSSIWRVSASSPWKTASIATT